MTTDLIMRVDVRTTTTLLLALTTENPSLGENHLDLVHGGLRDFEGVKFHRDADEEER